MTNAIEAKSAAQADVPKLFYVTSTGIVNDYHNVPIDWFAVRGFDELGPDLPWAAIIDARGDTEGVTFGASASGRSAGRSRSSALGRVIADREVRAGLGT